MISVIIPSYFAQKTIKDCLRSLLLQKTNFPYEILVVNSSKDQTSQIIKKGFPSVRFIQLEKRVFAGTARNIGIQKAKGNILCFIDADCEANPNWLSQMASWHQKGYEAVGGSIVNKSWNNIYSKAEYPLEILEFSPRNPKREVKFISAANSSFSREALEQVGLFPDVRAGEDLVLGFNLVKKGHKILFDPEIRVFHKNDINFRAFFKKQLMHGKFSFQIRQKSKLSGSFLNKPLVLPLVFPFLPFIRTFRIISQSLRLKNKLLYDIVCTFPVFFGGCLLWTLGYIKEYIENI